MSEPERVEHVEGQLELPLDESMYEPSMWNGKPHVYSPAERADHQRHIHWPMLKDNEHD